MFLKDFLYFLTDATGACFRVNGDIIETTTTPTPLPVAPNGWDDVTIEFGRSAKYHGLVRSFTTPLKFVKTGAKILRDRFYKYGTESRVFLVMNWLDKTFGGGWTHNFFYKGELDLSKLDDSEIDVTVNVLEGLLSKYLKANENTIYEIPVNVGDAKLVLMDGVSLQSVVTFALVRSLTAQSLGRKQILPSVFVNTDGNYFHYTFKNDYGDLVDLSRNEITGEDLTQSDKWLFKAVQPTKVNIRLIGGITGNPQFPAAAGNAGNTWHVETSVGQSLLIGTLETAFSTGTIVPFDINVNVNLEAGETVFVYRMSTAFNNSGFWIYNDETQIQVTTTDRADPTYIKALTPVYLGQQLVNLMTGSTEYVFESEYLSSVWAGLLMTGFDAIRGIENPKMKISFSKFFDSYNVPCNLSLEIVGNTIKVERKAAAYQYSPVTDLGEAKGLVNKTATEHQFNTVRIGYPDMKTTNVNGRDEFNTYHIYSSPVTREAKELAIISPAIASMYEIEFARVGITTKPNTENSEVDNDVALLHCTAEALPGEGYFRLYRGSYDSITGILDSQYAFNVELSPKRCLIRHGDYLRAVFYWLEAKKLVFTFSPKSSELTTVLGPDVIAEKAEIYIADLAVEPLFIPVQCVFKSTIPKDIVSVMKDNPNRSFSFTWNGYTFFAFAVSVKIRPSNNAEQEFTGLLRPDNNLLNFT